MIVRVGRRRHRERPLHHQNKGEMPMEFETTMLPKIPIYVEEEDEVYFYNDENDLACSIHTESMDSRFVNSQDLEMAKRNADKLKEMLGK